MWDCTAYTFPGAYALPRTGDTASTRTLDAGGLRALLEGDALVCALCDTAGQGRGADETAQRFAEAVFAGLQTNVLPRVALTEANARLQFPFFPGITSGAFCVRDARLFWSGVGDVRLYHFSGGVLRHFSRDDTPAADALGPETQNRAVYEGLRFLPRSAEPSVRLGMGTVQPRADSYPVQPGDALLCCSSGFWRYLFETEMEIDRCKARSTEDWLTRMLLRIALRTHMDGERFSVLALSLPE